MDDRPPLPSELPPEEYERWRAGVLEDAAQRAALKRESMGAARDAWPLDKSASGVRAGDVTGAHWALMRGD